MENSPDFSKDLAEKKKSLSVRVSKTTLKKPNVDNGENAGKTSGSGLTLKKPQAQDHSKKLRPPGSIQLRKPGESNNSGNLQLKNPGEAEASPQLKNPLEPSRSLEEGESKKGQSLKNPGKLTGSASADSDPVLQLKNQADNEEKSRLSVPGSLSLKKTDLSNSSQKYEPSTGLRLRQPSETPTLEEQLKDQHQVEESKDESNDNELPKDSGISLKLKKQKDSPSKEKSGPDLTPPGLEVPDDKKAKEDSKTQPNKKDGSTPSPEDSTVTGPSEDLQFTRKQKRGMTAKQKKQITFVWVPLLLVFVVLGYLFVSKLLFPIPAQDPDPAEIRSGKNKKNSRKQKKTSKDSTKTGKKLKPKGIKFPDELLLELDKEYGVEAKNQFLDEWKKLSNENRKKYLVEINAWKEEYEVQMDKK